VDKVTLCLIVLLLGSARAFAREPKEYHSDVIYDEGKIPHYDPPPLLVTAQGEQVTTAEQWHNARRPQILSLFSNLVYGRVPEPESPVETEFEIERTAGVHGRQSHAQGRADSLSQR
jgi:hypothetical protein